MSTVVRVQGLSKRYRLGLVNRKLLYQELQSRWARWRGREDPNERVSLDPRAPGGELWALKDVTFDVRDGDVLGVIGRNGSGKSTLLKILSQITAPTEGRVMIKGRIASLLEVGTGFHQELTGRDNVFLNGVILGMSHDQVAARFDSIVEFSGIEKFIDTPVKRYSSGMSVRLAFAVAAHLDPEILVIDEVLAVGDQAFQQKCLGKISGLARAGRTVLFVSHNAAAVENLCTRGIVLEQGRLMFSGTQTEAIEYYARSLEAGDNLLRDRTDRMGTGEVRIVAIDFRDLEGRPVSLAAAGQDLDVYLHFENRAKRQFPNLIVSIQMKTLFDVSVFQQQNLLTGDRFPSPLPERGAFVCRLRRLPLPASSYRLNFSITSDHLGGELLDSVSAAAELHVEGGDFFGSGLLPAPHAGLCLADAAWRLDAGAITEPTVAATPALAATPAA